MRDDDEPLSLDEEDEEPRPRRKRKLREDEDNPPRKTLPISWIILVGCAVPLLGISLFTLWAINKGLRNAELREVKNDKAMDIPKNPLVDKRHDPSITAISEPAITVDVDDLEAEYQTNPAAADLKYKNKKVCVTFAGKIRQRSDEYIWEHVPRKNESLSSIAVEVLFRDSKSIAEMKPGIVYTVEGTCTGIWFATSLQIKNAVLIASP